MSKRAGIRIAAVIGLALGAAGGWLVGWLARSDNVPFFIALGALAGIWGGLAWARAVRPRVLGAIGLLALLLIAVWFTPPRAPLPAQATVTAPASVASPTPRPGGLTPDQAATLSSLRKVDDYPLYTMRYIGSTLSGGPQPGVEGAAIAQDARRAFNSAGGPTPTPLRMLARSNTFACSLFAALGDAENRLFGRNFDWRYSPALLLFTDRPAAGGYASVSLVDIAYFGFDDGAVDLTTLPLAARRALLDAPGWPFDGMNEAGVAVGMAAVPQADERHDADKPAIGSLRVMREILDHAGNVDEAVTILQGYNIAWEGGPPLHYLAADRSGRAALVEFYGGEIVVLPNDGPWHAATNFTRSAVTGDAAGQCRRYDAFVRRLTAAAGQLDSRDALGLLQTAAQTEAATQWSVVYGLSTGQVDLVMGRTYSQVHTFWLGQPARRHLHRHKPPVQCRCKSTGLPEQRRVNGARTCVNTTQPD